MTGKLAAVDISGSHLLQKQAEVGHFMGQILWRQTMAAMMRVFICVVSLSILIYVI